MKYNKAAMKEKGVMNEARNLKIKQTMKKMNPPLDTKLEDVEYYLQLASLALAQLLLLVSVMYDTI